jgi:hypothetical protein
MTLHESGWGRHGYRRWLPLRRGALQIFRRTAAHVASKGFAVTRGELRTHRTIGDSGRWIDRSFCPICGSGILHTLELRGTDYMVIKAGSLDEPSVVTPEYEIFVRSKLPWVSVSGETVKLDDMVSEQPQD